MTRHRKLRGRKLKKQKKIIIVSIICLTLLLSTGYAAFSTNISLSAKGNIKEKPKHTAAETITELVSDTTSNLITDDYGNIRYSGLNVNNYVCMEDEVTCSEDNLYRIIGIFNDIKTSENDVEGETRIKVIKATKYGDEVWNSTKNNDWTQASLMRTLNSTSFSLYSSNLIDNAVWNIGGTTDVVTTAKNMYNHERGTTTNNNNVAPSTWTGKVALMYPSDYGYASSVCYNSINLSSYNDSNCTESNWLYLDSYEWLQIPLSSSSTDVYAVYSSGAVASNFTVSYRTPLFRPAVYLKSNVAIKEDSERNGSEEHPYLLELIEEEE